MKAMVIREHGGPEVVELARAARAGAGPGEVVVAVKAAALNHLDIWVRKGWPGLEAPLPARARLGRGGRRRGGRARASTA